MRAAVLVLWFGVLAFVLYWLLTASAILLEVCEILAGLPY